MSDDRFKEALANHFLGVSVALGDANQQADLARRLGDSDLEARKVRALAMLEGLHRMRREKDQP